MSKDEGLKRTIVIDEETWDKIIDIKQMLLDLFEMSNYNSVSKLLKSLAHQLDLVDNANDEIHTVEDVALYLNVCPRTVYRMIQKGELKAKKNGKNYLVSNKSVVDLKKHYTRKKNTISIATLKMLGLVKGEN